MAYFYLLLVFLFSFQVQAAVYKTVDENGNVIYTDVKPRDTEGKKMELPGFTPIKGVSGPASPNKKNKRKQELPPVELKILEPGDNATVRNSGNFSVRLSVTPGLSRNWKVRLYLDGELIEAKRGLIFQLSNIDRGSHQIKVEVIDINNQVIASAGNTVHVHKTIVAP